MNSFLHNDSNDWRSETKILPCLDQQKQVRHLWCCSCSNCPRNQLAAALFVHKTNINGNVKMSPFRASMLNKNLAYRLLKMLINFYKFNISYLYYTSISWQHQNQHYAEDFASGLHETVLHVWLPVGPIKTGLYTWHFTILELCCTVKPLCKDSSLLHTVCLVLTYQVWP